jgi:hypothetical protein
VTPAAAALADLRREPERLTFQGVIMNDEGMPSTWLSKAIGTHRGPQAIASAIAAAPEFLDLVRQGVEEVNQKGADEAGDGRSGGEHVVARAVLRGLAQMYRPD